MVHKGPLNKRDGEITVYLFDHAILFTKLVKGKGHEQFKVYRRVRMIPLSGRPVSCIADTLSCSAYTPRTSLHLRRGRWYISVYREVTTQGPLARQASVVQQGTRWCQ